MMLSAEISLYPLANDAYKAQILQFIDELEATPGLTVKPNGMSTQVFGEYDLVTQTLMSKMKEVHEKIGSAVLVCKFVPGDRSSIERD